MTTLALVAAGVLAGLGLVALIVAVGLAALQAACDDTEGGPTP